MQEQLGCGKPTGVESLERAKGLAVAIAEEVRAMGTRGLEVSGELTAVVHPDDWPGVDGMRVATDCGDAVVLSSPDAPSGRATLRRSL